MNSARGFTLIEVAIALAVIAIALLALFSAATEHTRRAAGLEERSIATWIAADRLAEIRLQPGYPEPGVQHGTQTMAGREWSWRAVISDAPGESDLRRIDVAVAHGTEIENPTALLTGFVGRHRVTTEADNP